MTALSHLTTPTGTESLPLTLPTYPTQRSIIRRAKTAHGIKAQHKAHEAIGPDGGAYIHVCLFGSTATLIIELDTMGVEE
jgi:hypothetical protein